MCPESRRNPTPMICREPVLGKYLEKVKLFTERPFGGNLITKGQVA